MFSYLDKSEKDQWLPQLFDILYENMHSIAPTGFSYDQERASWLSAVSPALEKKPRKIVLCFVNGKLAGYIQYYIREQMLMVEEIQLKKEYHHTLLFYSLCKYLSSVLPNNLQTIEAYADKRNLASISLMQKLGMHLRNEEPDPTFVHMQGPMDGIYALFKQQ